MHFERACGLYNQGRARVGGGGAMGGWLDERKIEYRYGKIIKNEFTEDELNSIVATVGAYGGWTHTNYWVSLK